LKRQKPKAAGADAMADGKDKIMKENQKYGILWSKWAMRVVTVLGGTATYLGLLFGVMILAARMAKGCRNEGIEAAITAVWFTTVLHWFVFALIEHGHLKHMNENENA
jgi:hypothetical protein